MKYLQKTFLWPHAFVLLCIGLAATLVAESRIWTEQATGKTIEAELIRSENGNAVLNFQGRQVSVPINILREADQAFIASQQSDASRPGQSAEPLTPALPEKHFDFLE